MEIIKKKSIGFLRKYNNKELIKSNENPQNEEKLENLQKEIQTEVNIEEIDNILLNLLEYDEIKKIYKDIIYQNTF